MSVGDYWGNLALAYLVNRDVWVSLHSYDPGVSGVPASEINGGGYIRDKLSKGVWNSASGRQITTNKIIEFNNLEEGTITHVGIWDTEASGNIIASGVFATPITVADGNQVIIVGGDIAISLVA